MGIFSTLFLLKKLNNSLDTYRNSDVELLEATSLEAIKNSFKGFPKPNIHAKDDEALLNAIKSKNIEAVKFLLHKGANPHARNNNFLLSAISTGKLDIVKLLCEKGVKHNQALNSSLRGGHIEISKYLMQEAGYLNLANSENLLANAVFSGKLELVKYIYNKGFNINANNNEAVKIAAQFGYQDVIEYLVDNGANKDIAIMEAAKYGQIETVKLLDNNFNKDKILSSVLEAPSYINNKKLLSVVKYAIDNGANFRKDDDKAFLTAVMRDMRDITEYLIEKGADVHTNNDKALIIAVNLEDGLPMTKILINNGADVHAQDDEPFRTAIKRHYIPLQKLLLDNGANLHIDNNALLKSAIYTRNNDEIKLYLEYNTMSNKELELFLQGTYGNSITTKTLLDEANKSKLEIKRDDKYIELKNERI